MSSLANQIPHHILSVMAGLVPEAERRELLLLSKRFNEVMLPIVWYEPDFKTLSLPEETFMPLLEKYGKYIRAIPASEAIGLDRLKLILSKCTNLRCIYFYGNASLWSEIYEHVPVNSLRSIEFCFLGDITSDTIDTIGRFTSLTELNITYDNVDFVNRALNLIPEGQLKKFSAYQITAIRADTIKIIKNRFPNLESLQFQSGTIDEDAVSLMNSKLLNLKLLELDIYLYKRDYSPMVLSADNFPSLEHILIDFHFSKMGACHLILFGKWKSVQNLSLFRVNTQSDRLLCNDNFPNLRALQLQVYHPFTQDSLRLLFTDLPFLTKLHIDKFQLTDNDFDFPKAFYFPPNKIQHFDLTNNVHALGPHYLSFIIQNMNSMVEWTLPTLKNDPIIKKKIDYKGDHLSDAKNEIMATQEPEAPVTLESAAQEIHETEAPDSQEHETEAPDSQEHEIAQELESQNIAEEDDEARSYTENGKEISSLSLKIGDEMPEININIEKDFSSINIQIERVSQKINIKIEKDLGSKAEPQKETFDAEGIPSIVNNFDETEPQKEIVEPEEISSAVSDSVKTEHIESDSEKDIQVEDDETLPGEDEEDEQGEVEAFIQTLIDQDVGPFLPSLNKFLLDANDASVPLAHFVAQSCSTLSYMFVNMLDDSMEVDEIREAFQKANPNMTLKVE